MYLDIAPCDRGCRVGVVCISRLLTTNNPNVADIFMPTSPIGYIGKPDNKNLQVF
jgi:hypothetical protein